MIINFTAGFSAIRDQEKAVRRLTGLLQSGNIPHALLFTGMDGVGKKKTALTFAKALNCRRTRKRWMVNGDAMVPCGKCRPCKKISSGNHPDIIVIEPEKSRIKIARIRELGHMLAAKPYEAMQRVVIIDQAQAMNPEAGNSLLKMLEEPPEKTFLVLTAGSTGSLLPTVVSRCQQIRFRPIPVDTLVKYLGQQGIPHGEAEILGRLANGSFGKAASLADTDWVSRRAWIIRIVEHHDQNKKSLLKSAEYLAFSEQLSQDRSNISDALEILQSWFRDLAVIRAGAGKVVNRDLIDRIKKAARRHRTPSLLSKIDVLEEARQKIEANANVRLTLDVMMMKLCSSDECS